MQNAPALKPDLDRLLDRGAFFKYTAVPVKISNLEAHDVKVRIMGDVAIIHAQTTHTMPDGWPGHSRYTDVWARRNGQWLAVSAASQGVRLR